MSSSLLEVVAPLALAGVFGPAGVPLSLAFGAGVLSTLNPCGFALLPAYISYTVEQQVQAAPDHRPGGWGHLLRGGLLGLPLAAGFLLIFLLAGGVLALGGRLLVQLFPWLAILVGIGLVLLGGWSLLTRRTLEIPRLGVVVTKVGASSSGRPKAQSTASPVHAWRAAWVFGLGYGLSSLGCTLPVFLLVVGTTITSSGVGGAALVLASYAAGMALVLLAVALAATQVGDLLSSTVLTRLGWVQPLAALLLILAGGYIVFYQVRAGLW